MGELAASLAVGPHALLAGLIGDWAGMTQTWFMPGESSSSRTSTFRPAMTSTWVSRRGTGASTDGRPSGGIASTRWYSLA